METVCSWSVEDKQVHDMRLTDIVDTPNFVSSYRLQPVVNDSNRYRDGILHR